MNKFYKVPIGCVKHVLGARLPTKEIPVYLCVRRYDEGATGRNEGRQVAHVTTPMAHASLALAGVSSSMIRYPCCCSGSLVMIVFALSGRALGLPVQVSLSAVPGARGGRGKEDRLPVCMCVCTVLWHLLSREEGGQCHCDCDCSGHLAGWMGCDVSQTGLETTLQAGLAGWLGFFWFLDGDDDVAGVGMWDGKLPQ